MIDRSDLDRVLEAEGAIELLKLLIVYSAVITAFSCRGSGSDGAIETSASAQLWSVCPVFVVEAVRAMELLKPA